MSKIFILISILFILICSPLSYYNERRHLSASYPYAHFSQITPANLIIHPQILLTSPQHFTLHSGEALFIPRGWWHWIRTDLDTQAISFFFSKNDSLSSVPHKIHDLLSISEAFDINRMIDMRIQKQFKNLWNNSSFEPLSYAITLEGYTELPENMKAKETLESIPFLSKIRDRYARLDEQFDSNLWLSLSPKERQNWLTYHDTGLHYDTLDGILYVVRGKKTITLYPPEDSRFLSPYDMTPNYATQPAILMNYNAHSFYRFVPGKPSGYLLYKTLESCAKYSKVLTAVQKIYDNKDGVQIIWGFKKSGDTYRWEFYFYHYSMHSILLMNKTYLDRLHPGPISSLELDILKQKDVIIHSIDIDNSNRVYNGEVHTYDVTGPRSLPFRGRVFDTKDATTRQVSSYIYDTANNVKGNLLQVLSDLGLPYSDSIRNVMYKYTAQFMCIHNKNGDLFVQWLMIPLNEFISFLEEFDYKESLIRLVKENPEDFIHLSHEITIVYDPVTLVPKRSGFYGCF